MTSEYVRAGQSYGRTYTDLKQMVRTGIEHIFLPGESLWAAPDKFTAPVAACSHETVGSEKPSASCSPSSNPASAMLLSRAHHCFIHVRCRDYDVTIELYGPSQQDPKHGSPHKNPFNPNRRGIRRPITSPWGCDGKGNSKNCQLEDNLLNAFQKESGNIPLYNPYPGPNSNTFVQKIISEAGGDAEFPNQAYGSDYVGP
jgi:hypothetical protein